MEFTLDTDLLARETIEKQRVSGVDVARSTLQHMVMACFKDKEYKRLVMHTESAPAKELNWKKWIKNAKRIEPTYLKVMKATEKNMKISTNFGMLLGAQQSLLKPAFDNAQITGENWDAVSAATYKQALRTMAKEQYPPKLAETHADTIALQSSRMWVRSGVFKTLQTRGLLPSSLSTMYEHREIDRSINSRTIETIFVQISAIDKRVMELIDRDLPQS